MLPAGKLAALPRAFSGELAVQLCLIWLNPGLDNGRKPIHPA